MKRTSRPPKSRVKRTCRSPKGRPSESPVMPWVRLLDRIYNELQASRMLRREPAEILSRATEHLNKSAQERGEDLGMHLVTTMLLFALALESGAEEKKNLSAALKRVALDSLNVFAAAPREEPRA